MPNDFTEQGPPERANRTGEYSQPESGRNQQNSSGLKTATSHQVCDRLLAAVEKTARASVSANSVGEALRVVVKLAAEICEARAVAAWVIGEDANHPRLVASVGTEGELGGDLLEAAKEVMAESTSKRRSVRVEADRDAKTTSAILAVPLVAFDEALGAILLFGKSGNGGDGSGSFTKRDMELLQVLAAQAAVTVQSSRLFARCRESSQRLQEAERLVLQSEKLAALGEMSAKVAHEIRNPLSAIGGFARRIEKALDLEDPNRNYASIMVREISRLEAILNEQLQFAANAQPRLSPVDLRGLVREAVELVRDEMDKKGVQLIQQGGGGLPTILLDGDRIKQVLLNILNNAIASTQRGQQVRLRTRAADGWVRIEIANNGERMPGEVLDQLFVPFATARSGGHGLGMAVADQIVKEHGGEIRVQTSDEWSVLFTVSLPIRTNKDRRQKPNRRRSRDRRRAA